MDLGRQPPACTSGSRAAPRRALSTHHGALDDVAVLDELAARRRRSERAAKPAQGPPDESFAAPQPTTPAVPVWSTGATEPGTAKAPITWLFDPESFAPMAKLVGDARYAIITDHLGTPTAMYDAAGAEVWSATIDAYGDLRNITGTRTACPFRWPGQYEDAETGLYYNRFRYYDPSSGAYVTSDPLGCASSHPNHQFVRDPLIQFDPLGLTECVKGEPLPDDTKVHRIGGADAAALQLKPAERKSTPPGISLLRAESPEEAAHLAKDVAQKQGWTRMATAAETMGSATAADIRAAGFDVIHDPTATWGEAHARLIHPQGEQGFTPENLQKLANVFANKGGL